MPKVPVDFAGPSYFGGRNDQLVLCAGKGQLPSSTLNLSHPGGADLVPAGDIHIWDRESGTLLHHIRSQTVGGDLTCIAWNHAWDTFMFATGSHDGGVRIWTSPALMSGSEDNSVAPSRATTNPANTPRTVTPSPYDPDYRTDSPDPQLTPESSDGHAQAAAPSPSSPVTGAQSQARPSVVSFS